MSYGAGHIADMVRRMKQNAALKSSRRSKRGKDHTRRSGKTLLKFPNPSKGKPSNLSKKHRLKNKRYLLLFSVFLICLFVGLTILSLYIMP
jgi:hypothetical protein